MSLITELPHAEYDGEGIDAIDFRLEKMPMSADDKKKFAKAFLSGKGIIGLMPKTNKYLLFTPNDIKVLKNKPKDKSLVLPPNWQKYAVILRDWSINMNKERIKEILRPIVREVMLEKWKDDVDIKKTGEHADKTIEQLKKEIEALRGKPGNKEKMGELIFALRAKQGWKKGEGSTGLTEANIKDDANKLIADLKKKGFIRDGQTEGKAGSVAGGGKFKIWAVLPKDYKTFKNQVKSTYKKVGETQLGLDQFQSPYGFYFWMWNDDGSHAYLQVRRKKK